MTGDEARTADSTTLSIADCVPMLTVRVFTRR
jgi:hypothetical protein